MNVTVTQTLSPVKLAFLIPPNKKKSYLRALRVCSSMWGGKFFPILVFQKSFSKVFRTEYGLYTETVYEYYGNALANFDPQYLVLDPLIKPADVDKIKGNMTCISITELEDSILQNQTKYGISIEEILHTIKERDFKFQRTDSLKVICPIINNKDLFTSTLSGAISRPYIMRLRNLDFPSKYISFIKTNRQNISKCISKNAISYLGLNSYYLESLGNPLWSSQYCIYFVNPDRLNDLVNVWNLRALGWYMVTIPINGLSDPFYQLQIKNQQKDFNSHTQLTDRISVIENSQLTSEESWALIHELSKIQVDENKKVQYSSQHWFPRFWNDRENLNYDKSAAVLVRSNQKKTLVTTVDKKISVLILQPPFEKRYIKHIQPRFINEVSIEFDEEDGIYAQALPDMPSKALDFIIRGSGFNQWYFSKGIMFFLSYENDEQLEFTIPKAKEVFEKWFDNKGIQIRHSAPGKLANELLKNIGGVYGTNFFANAGIPPILNLFENGKIRLKKTLDAEINRQLLYFANDNKQTIIQKLLFKKIIEYGNEVQCVFCNKHSFYKLEELSEKLKCPVCHNIYRAPIHSPEEMRPAYRGMGPFSKNNKAEGLVCVLLTLRFFKISLHSNFITPFLSFELLQNNAPINEVDIGIFVNARDSHVGILSIINCIV